MKVKTTKPYNNKPCFEHYQPLFASHNAQWKVFVALDMLVKTTKPYNNKPCFEHYQPLFASHNARWKVFVALDMLVKTTKPYKKNHVLNTINHFLHRTMLDERYLWLWICQSKQSNPTTKKPCFEHYQPLFASHNAQWKVFVSSQAEGRGVY